MPATSATGERATRAQRNRTHARGVAPGFTLIELLVVMAILVMIAGLIPLALDRALPARRVEAAARSAMAAIRDAQTQSIATGQPVGIKLTEEGNGLQAGTRTMSFSAGVRLTLRGPEGQLLPGLLMYPDGSTQSAQLRFSDATHESRMMVSGITGHVSLERPR